MRRHFFCCLFGSGNRETSAIDVARVRHLKKMKKGKSLQLNLGESMSSRGKHNRFDSSEKKVKRRDDKIAFPSFSAKNVNQR